MKMGELRNLVEMDGRIWAPVIGWRSTEVRQQPRTLPLWSNLNLDRHPSRCSPAIAAKPPFASSTLPSKHSVSSIQDAGAANDAAVAAEMHVLTIPCKCSNGLIHVFSGPPATRLQIPEISSNHIQLCARQPAAVRTPSFQVSVESLLIWRDTHSLAATQSVSADEETTQILAKQRLNRPVSPHLTIYRPQITWYTSMMNRITGIALSGGLYLFGTAYLVAPTLGWHLESQALAAAFASWPVILQATTKFLVSMPFTFHCFNGVRHLVWDTASMITNKQVNQTGWLVVGLTVVSSLILAIM